MILVQLQTHHTITHQRMNVLVFMLTLIGSLPYTSIFVRLQSRSHVNLFQRTSPNSYTLDLEFAVVEENKRRWFGGTRHTIEVRKYDVWSKNVRFLLDRRFLGSENVEVGTLLVVVKRCEINRLSGCKVEDTG